MTCFGLNDTVFSRISLVKKMCGAFDASLSHTFSRVQLLFASLNNSRNFGPIDGTGLLFKVPPKGLPLSTCF